MDEHWLGRCRGNVVGEQKRPESASGRWLPNPVHTRRFNSLILQISANTHTPARTLAFEDWRYTLDSAPTFFVTWFQAATLSRPQFPQAGIQKDTEESQCEDAQLYNRGVINKPEKWWAEIESSIFFAQSSVEGHLGCSPTLAIANNAATNTVMHMSFQISVLDFFGGVQHRLQNLVSTS